MLRDEIYAFLKRPDNKLGVVSSVTADGEPQSALVGFAVTPDLELIFDTLQATRKYPNLIQEPRCSFAAGLHGDATVQYQGVARHLTDPDELEKYLAVYFESFPDGPSRASKPGMAYILVSPRWIRFSDYGETPFRVEELSF